jgi:putative ABC transport system ATP-binding protein
MIRLLNVKKGFNLGKHNELTAVAGVSLTIEANRITVLKGPSGSGKTTLLNLIGCMARPTSGRVIIGGGVGAHTDFLADTGTSEVEVTSLPERFLTEIRRRTFGFVFQQFNLIRGITLLENVMLPAYPLGEKHALLKKRALSLLELFRIRSLAASQVEWLSGGEVQRAAMARALINDPPVIIADEPTAHLDSALSKEFMEIIASLKDRGKTVIIASHDPLVFGAAMVDRVIAVRDGRIDVE